VITMKNTLKIKTPRKAQTNFRKHQRTLMNRAARRADKNVPRD
jgi:hypothetical protein